MLLLHLRHHVRVSRTRGAGRRMGRMGRTALERLALSGFEEGGEFVTHLLPVHWTRSHALPLGRAPAVNRPSAKFLDRMPSEPCHCDRGAGMRVRFIPYEGLARDEAEFGADFFQAADSTPESLRNVGLGAEAFNQVESHVELIADDAVEFHRGVRDGEEDDSEGGDEEVVEDDLLRPVYVARLVQTHQHSNSVLCHFNHLLRVAAVFHYTGRGVQHRAVDEDAHLICADIQQEFVRQPGAGVCGLRWEVGGDIEAVGGGNGIFPLQDLEVEVFHVFTDFRDVFHVGGAAPNFGGEAGVGYGKGEVGS